MSEKKNLPYLHGFSAEEQARLRKQSRIYEHIIYNTVNLTQVNHLLEVGCGVGAQSEIIMRRFPNLKITGIDLNDKQLSSAKEHLSSLTWAKDRFEIQKMDATNMDFESNSFDGAFVCWTLEHIPDPERALSEIRRVLHPGSIIYVTEVFNSTFFLEPYSPNVWKYLQAFNDYQYENAGDPFIGAKLGNMLLSMGFREIKTYIKTCHLDNRRPSARKEFVQYWRDLLLSASDELIKEKRVTQEVADEAKKEFDLVSKDPNAVFFDAFVQAQAKVY